MSAMDVAWGKFTGSPDAPTLLAYVLAVDGAIADCHASPDSLPKYAVLKTELAQHVGRLDQEVAAATKAGKTTSALELAQKLVPARIETIEQAMGGFFENKRSLMANAQQWGTHFSNIRHLVTTFLAGISWGLVTLRWDNYSSFLKWSALGVWTLAVLLYCAFTKATFQRADEERKNLNHLLGRTGAGKHGVVDWGWWSFGAQLAALGCAWGLVSFCGELIWWVLPAGALLAVFLWLVPIMEGTDVGASASDSAGGSKPEPDKKRLKIFIRTVPDLAVAVATLGFGFLLHQWPVKAKPDSYSLAFSKSGETVVVTKLSGEKSTAPAPGATLGCACAGCAPAKDADCPADPCGMSRWERRLTSAGEIRALRGEAIRLQALTERLRAVPQADPFTRAITAEVDQIKGRINQLTREGEQPGACAGSNRAGRGLSR